MMFTTFEEDVTDSYWNVPTPWPPTCPFTYIPANTVIKQKPPNPTTGAPGKKKIRRSANFRHPWTKKRQMLFRKTGVRAPLAYNDDTPLPSKPSDRRFIGRSSGRPRERRCGSCRDAVGHVAGSLLDPVRFGDFKFASSTTTARKNNAAPQSG